MILHKSHTVPTTTLADIPLRPEKLPVTVSREFDAISPLICWRLILMIRPVWASNSMAAAWLFAIVNSCKIESPKWTRRRKINITSHLLMSSWPLEKKPPLKTCNSIETPASMAALPQTAHVQPGGEQGHPTVRGRQDAFIILTGM